MLGRTRRVHFVGVGGSGMSGIAELLANLGYAVSGSDARLSAVTAHLSSLGVTVAEGHDAANVGDADVVVYSSAVRPTNPEIVEASRRRIPVIPRAEMLAELMRLKYSVAVAGAHGKTTTTSMIALVLERGGLDPTAVIGGRLSAFGSSARLGRGDYMVVEADESDRSFLKLTPSVAIITNIDQEHLESYRDFEDLQQAFVDVRQQGAVLRHHRRLRRRRVRAPVAVGDDAARDHLRPRSARCPLPRPGRLRLRVRLALHRRARPAADQPGRRPAGRSSSARSCCTCRAGTTCRTHWRQSWSASNSACPSTQIAAALDGFRGAERRFEDHGEVRGVRVIEDYGHHPTEIAAVIGAARAALGRRLVVVFQPHRYSRTKRLLDRFGPALTGADEIVLTDIYAAGEDAVPGVTVEALADAIRRHVTAPLHIVKDISEVPRAVARLVKEGDVVMTLGAGSIGAASDAILAELGKP